MNKDICCIDYPDEYKSKYVWAHSNLSEELEIILERSGYKDQFRRKYRLRLKHLEERKETCFQKKDWFEHLKGTEGIHSLRVIGIKNIRVLFAIATIDGTERALLLTAFEEKKTKDYKAAIVIAEQRISEITRRNNNGE